MFDKIGGYCEDKAFGGSTRVSADNIGQRLDAAGRNKKEGLATWSARYSEVIMRSI